uniref:SRR1 domain containing n=1 Tax=Phasianus colchicus TaxID=9054 RepID=A0A669PM08_PHACC
GRGRMAAAAGGWCAASGRRRRRRAKEKEEDGGAAVLRRLQDARPADGRVSPRRDELLSSGFWAASAGACGAAAGGGGGGGGGRGLTAVPVPAGAVREPLGSGLVWRCVCYGLGRFAACPTARLQLAFLLLLLEMLAVPPSRCFLFDPAFSELELAALEALGLRLLPENEEGKHSINGSPTLFYMVHCGKALYNNLLWRNWSVGALSNMVIIGNTCTKVLLLCTCLPNFALPAHPRYLDTFNDTSIHWFPAHKLERLSAEIWEFVEEPTYEECDDLEIIKKGEEGSQHGPAPVQP